MIWRNEASQANQTEFVDQVPILERRGHQSLNWQTVRKNKNLWPFYVLIGLTLVIGFLLFLKALLSRPAPQSQVVIPKSESPELTPLNQRVNALRQELKENDPTKQSAPFPQVDLQFNIY